ncbi:MAG: hypothetical protein KAQ95_00790, partial [Candidatus Heimdallarchaeota archaeon]|nr:hypothetical protein [Candidatus Heimdallarchaeota archaeon]
GMKNIMTVVNKQYCPNCGKIGYRDDVSCVDCGFLLVDEESLKPEGKTQEEIKAEMKKIYQYKSNKPANFSIFFTVIAALMYGIPSPWISIFGGTPLSLFAIITAIIGLFNPFQKTRKIVAIVIAILAPAVWLAQFWFTGYYWI